MSGLKRIVIFALAGLAGGCAVGPTYQEPQMELPLAFSEPGSTTRPSEELQTWWTVFDDDVLNGLIHDALEANLDLVVARARVLEARKLRGASASGLFPDLRFGTSYTRTRTSGRVVTGGGGFNPDRESGFYDVGFDSGWEIDLFGGVRRGIEAADAEVEAAVHSQRDVQVALLSEVARNYIELRGAQREAEITRQNLATQQDTLELTRKRFGAGIASDLDVARSEAQVATTSSELPLQETRQRQAIYRLSVLLGQPPLALMNRLSDPGPIPVGHPDVPLGLPSELLRRRADVRRAERQLAGATARVGVAVAELFPKISLTGGIGRQAPVLSQLGGGLAQFWTIGPQFQWNIFSAGRIQSRIEAADAVTEQALALYRQSVLEALEDVESALVAHARERDRLASLQQAVEANRRAVGLSKQLYDRGVVDFLNVLEAQRSLFASEALLVRSQISVSTSLVALYKALGGGWEVPTHPEHADSGPAAVQ